MFKISQLLKIIQSIYYKTFHKKQAHSLKSFQNPIRRLNDLKIRPRFKTTLLVFLISILFLLSFQQFYLQNYSSKNKKMPSSHPVRFMGTMIADENAIAVVNEKSLRVGDDLYGLRIVAIHENKLDLKGPQGKMSLNVGSTYYL